MHRYHLGARVGIADHRSRVVRKDTRHGRLVADITVDDADERDDGGLVSGDAVEVADGRS
jgi:hypothetical protein